MSARYPWLNFQYAEPEPGFDHSQVKGVVGTLFDVKDPKYFQALDTACGGKVRSVQLGTCWRI